MVGTAELTASAEAETLSNSSGGDSNNVDSSNSSSTNNFTAISAQDQERLTKFGVLLVNLGAASEEKVFGMKCSAAMQMYQNHTMSDLLVINRKEDDAAAYPFYWYKPWTWWGSGRQVSPMVRVAEASLQLNDEEQSAKTIEAAVNTDATQTEEADLPLPPMASYKTKPKRKGLPAIDLRPLTDDEVATLTPAVQEDRDKILKAEEHIHTALQNIEDTRYRYLVPARDLHCEAEVVAVVKCYAECHKTAAIRTKVNAATSRDGSSSHNDAVLKKEASAVRADLLACGPDVERLKQCTEAMTMRYNREGELA